MPILLLYKNQIIRTKSSLQIATLYCFFFGGGRGGRRIQT